MPAIATDPQGDKAIRLEVGTVLGDMSWIWLPFESALDTGQHPVVTVSFDVYRYDYAGSSSATNWNHNLFWAWTDENDEALVPTTEPGFPKPSSPTWGAQWDVSAETYPFRLVRALRRTDGWHRVRQVCQRDPHMGLRGRQGVGVL